MEEIWKDIYFIDKGIEWDYRGLYQVSNLGNVKSLNYNHSGKEKLLSPSKHKSGYLITYLSKNKIRKYFAIHRLVAFMFIENDDKLNKTEINHKDENKENNCIDNLEWCTRNYNNNYGTRNERARNNMKGKTFSDEHKQKMSENHADFTNGKHPRARKVCQYDKDMKLIKIWDCIKDISEYYDWKYGTLLGHLDGRCKHEYKGYLWYYMD